MDVNKEIYWFSFYTILKDLNAIYPDSQFKPNFSKIQIKGFGQQWIFKFPLVLIWLNLTKIKNRRIAIKTKDNTLTINTLL